MNIYIIGLDNLSISAKENLKSTISNSINKDFPDLRLEALESIYICENFTEELIKFQKNNGLKEGHSKDYDFVVAGKVLNYFNDGEIKFVIFLHGIVANLWFYPEKSQIATHLFHHELCHVHDDYTKYKIFKNYFKEIDESKLENVLSCFSNMIWSEFIATYLSVKSIPSDHDLMLKSLCTLIENVPRDIENEIINYNQHKDFTLIFQKFQIFTLPLLKSFAYVQGYIQGLSDNDNNFIEIIDISNKSMENTIFSDIWLKISIEFKKLNNNYKDWDDAKIFKKLNTIIRYTWIKLGLMTYQVPEGIYISVNSDIRNENDSCFNNIFSLLENDNY